MTKSAKSTTTVATEHCVQWNNACSVDQSILDETNVICYLRSLEWPVNENVVFDRGIIIKDCNDLMTLFGRKVVTRRSDGTLIQLVCKHANEYRPAKGTKTADSKIISQPINPCQQSFVEDADMSTSQSINPLVTEPLYPSSIEPAQVQQPQVTGSGEPSQTSNDQTKPAPKARLTTTSRVGCEFALNFTLTWRARDDGDERVSYRSWRISSSVPAVSFEDCNHVIGHSSLCKPDLRLKNGGILFMSQLTQAMIDDIMKMHNGRIKLSQIRTAVQIAHKVPFIDFALIQNVVNQSQPRDKKPEIQELVEHCEASDDIEYQCKWQNACAGGSSVKEIRNIFWATHQMLRMFHEYGSFLVVDATCRSNKLNMKLLLFTVRVGDGSFTIVGLALLQHETSEDLHWAFMELLKAASLYMQPSSSSSSVVSSTSAVSTSSSSTSSTSSTTTVHPQSLPSVAASSQGEYSVDAITMCSKKVLTVMTDGAAAYPALLKDIFPHAVHQLCYWHQMQNMEKFCIRKAKKASWNEMLEVLEHDEEDEAERLWRRMMRKFFHTPFLEIPAPAAPTIESETEKKSREKTNKKRANARALLAHWYDIRFKYWQCFTKFLLNYGSISSQAAESLNHAIKRQNYVTLRELINMTRRVTTNHLFNQMKSVNKAYRLPIQSSVSTRSWVAQLQADLSVFCTELLTEQFDLAQMYGVEVNHEARNLTLNHMQCSCSFFNQYGLMCRHLMASWLLDTCKSSPADQTSQNQATALTIKSLLTDELNHQLADVCINATPQRWTHAAAYRVFDEKHAPVEARTHTITHHQFSNSPSVPHVPESNFMQQLEIDHWLERIRRASQQHEVAAQITIMELSETHSRIEQRCAAQTSSTSSTSSLNSRLSVNFSSQLETTEPTVSMPKDVADPVNARHKRVLSTLSTKESGKQLAKRQKAAVSP